MAAQFVTTSVILIVARKADSEEVRSLLDYFDGYSGSFRYEAISTKISINVTAMLIYDEAYKMARVLLQRP